MEITQIRGDDRNHDGQRAHRECVSLPPLHKQQFYDEPYSDEDEDYADGIFERRKDGGDHHRRGDPGFRGHGGQGFKGYGGRGEQNEYWMKMDLPTFDGHFYIEDSFDWQSNVERFFDYMAIPKDKKVKLVAYKLIGGASAWWE